MKKMEIELLEIIEGGLSSEAAIGLMCGAAVCLALSPAALLATGPAIGCATGLYAMLCVW